jgi:hypothetical protein
MAGVDLAPTTGALLSNQTDDLAYAVAHAVLSQAYVSAAPVTKPYPGT